MADLWNWNRPDEPGLEAPSPFLDPVNYVGGVGGLISKLASRGVGKALQHGSVFAAGKVPPLSSVDKVASLRRAVEGINKKADYSKLANGLNELMEKAGWTYKINP